MALAALACAAGCAGPSPPTLEVTDAVLTEESPEGIVVTFRVRAENRNDDPLPLRTVRYSLTLDGRTAFSGERFAEATIRRQGSQEFFLPVALTVGENGVLRSMPPEHPEGVPYSLSGSVEYQIPGTIAEVLFDSNIRRPTAGFSESGRLDFSQMAAPGVDR